MRWAFDLADMNLSLLSPSSCRFVEADYRQTQHRAVSLRQLSFLFGKLVANPICAANLKLLALTVAKISRGSHFLDAPLAKTPANFGPKRCFLVS